MAMKFSELAQHLHELRETRTGRRPGAAMRLFEVWNGVLDSPLTQIKKINYAEIELPRPVDGVFVRLKPQDQRPQEAIILVHRHLEPQDKEFAAIKEMMHCWSPETTYVSGTEVGELVSALCDVEGRYTPSVGADQGAILAAAEVILPHATVEWHQRVGHDIDQIAVHHSLHPKIVAMICRWDILHFRKNGGF